jgi:nucleoside-diphosphate-sugar epimerase
MLTLTVDASGVIYVSTPIVFDADPAKSIDPIVKGTINTLQAAAQAGVKRYVLSSSSKGVESTVYNTPHTLTKDSYNYKDLHKAREEPVVDNFERAVIAYSGGRAAAELAFWDWIKTNNPPFTANVVVPDGSFGRVLGFDQIQGNLTTSCGMLKGALAGEPGLITPYVGKLKT